MIGDDSYRMGEVREHIEDHITYPATREAILAACSNMDHLGAEDKKWVEDTLPEGLYQSSEDVERAMGILK